MLINKIGSLYAGVDGIALGFEQAGAQTMWSNEMDKNACETIRANFNHKVYECKIEDLNTKDLEYVDVLTAGFPCQSFSIAGYQKGFEDERGHHFFEVIRLAKSIKPKVIFLENVKNLKSHDKGNTFQIICDTLNEIGYNFKYDILNSCDYGNVPQNRERIYMVCFRDDLDITKFKFPDKIPLTVSFEELLENNVNEKFYYREDKYNYSQLLETMTKTDTVYQWRRVYARENKKGLCPTLTANMGTGGHNVPLILTSEGIRKLTPRECFNLQGFPMNFILPDKMSNAQLYKQAGNSVSVPVIHRIATNILNLIN